MISTKFAFKLEPVKFKIEPKMTPTLQKIKVSSSQPALPTLMMV
jgi:hypothetical protein